MVITKPLLAATLKDEALNFPIYATPKLDGIRLLILDNKCISRSFKEIKNVELCKNLLELGINGCDGEIILKDKSISDITSFVNSKDKKMVDVHVQYFVFDMINDHTKGYLERIKEYPEAKEIELKRNGKLSIVPLIPIKINNAQELQEYEEVCLNEGYEGVMIRKGNGMYKCGRSTIKEGILVKLKRFKDTEAKIVGFEELYHNENEIEKNELNENFRSFKKEGKRQGNTLGAFIVESDFNNKKVEFKIGTGFTQQQRQEFWNTKESLVNKLVKFKYFEMGSKNVPRHPVFLCIRSADDL